MIYDYFEDVKMGNKVVSGGRTITEADVVMFCMVTGNWESVHSDADFQAKHSPFGQRLASGTFMYSLTPGLLPRARAGVVVAGYGVESIKYTSPVFIGDTVHVEMEYVKKEDRGPKGGVVSCQATMKNQRDQVVQISVTKVLVAKKPAAAP